MRPCLTCGALTSGTRCPAHQRAKKRALYGNAHQRDRAAWSPLVASGQVICWRCGLAIQPGTAWDLGHRQGLPSQPEHAGPCNRSAGAKGLG